MHDACLGQCCVRCAAPSSINLKWTHGGGPAPSCPQVVDGGCAGSPGGTFTVSGFSAHARTSGQTWTSSHPWNWNSCAIDYPCANYSANASLHDPATQNPTGCTYNATGNTAGGPIENCTGAIDIEGFDFSLHGCVPVLIDTGATSLTIKNSRFVAGTNCLAENQPGIGSFLVHNNCCTTVPTDIESNYIDGNMYLNGSVMNYCFLLNPNSGALTLKYNAILRCDVQPITTGACCGNPPGNVVSQYNYVEDFIYLSSNHGEFVINSWSGTGTMALQESQYDTVLLTSSVKINGSTALVYMTGGTGAGTYTQTTVDHDVLIANTTSSGTQPSASALVELGNSASSGQITYTNTTITNSFLDQEALGLGYSEFSNIGSPGAICTHAASFSGNVRLTTGASVNAWTSNTGTGC